MFIQKCKRMALILSNIIKLNNFKQKITFPKLLKRKWRVIFFLNNEFTFAFTDEIMPETADLIDIDNDGDCGMVAWIDGTVMKVSS